MALLRDPGNLRLGHRLLGAAADRNSLKILPAVRRILKPCPFIKKTAWIIIRMPCIVCTMSGFQNKGLKAQQMKDILV